MNWDITSPHNPRLKRAAKLRERRSRREQQRILIDGARELSRAIESGWTIEEVFHSPSSHPAETQAVQQAREAGAEVFAAPPEIFRKLAYGDRESGLAATAPLPEYSLEQLARSLETLDRPPLVMVLEAVEKPGNLGAVLRTADAAGVSAVIAADGISDFFNPNCIRASLGAVFTAPTAWASSHEVKQWLEANGFRMLAARVEGSIDYAAADYSGACALLLGSEADGLSEVWRGPAVQAISLPMHGKVDSLNVSAAAAVLMYEAQRQRR